MTTPTVAELMTEFLSLIGQVVTQVMTWLGTVTSTIVSTPLLIFYFGFFALGGTIGILGRMIRRG